MTAGHEPLDRQVRSFLERTADHGMLRVALVAFAVGVFLHVCVVYAVLGDGKSSSSASVGPAPANGVSQPAVAATPTPSRLADRTSCEAIRGTDYRSDTERLWFRANCA